MNKRIMITLLLVVGVAAGALVVWAVSPSAEVRVFRTIASAVALNQIHTNGIPRYGVTKGGGQDLCYWALGNQPSSNQFFAMEINCDSSQINLVVYDELTSNVVVRFAQSQRVDKILQADLHTGVTNQERFAALFEVLPTGFLAGGYFSMTGRLDLDTNGCVGAVLMKLDRDPLDKLVQDIDVKNADADKRKSDPLRAGRADFLGAVDLVDGGQTNAVLVPWGRVTLRRQLDEYIVVP